jgi:hypothetical protein
MIAILCDTCGKRLEAGNVYAFRREGVGYWERVMCYNHVSIHQAEHHVCSEDCIKQHGILRSA